MIFISSMTYFLLPIALMALTLIMIDYVTSKKKSKTSHDSKELSKLLDPPGPKPWPVTGSLHILGRYDVPYKVFGDLVKTYNSQVIKLQMGSVPCVVVNGLENIKEVCVTKGHHFDSRPNFVRYHSLFGGDKENSLAFCNWSDVLKTRKEMLRGHAFPQAFTTRYNQLNGIIGGEVGWLINYLAGISGVGLHAKPLIMHTCANIFIKYFCSRSFALGHAPLREMIENFDKVFYEVNQGYTVDFMPFLTPLYQRHMTRIANLTEEIRKLMEKNIIGDRLTSWRSVIPEEDYVDCLINYVKTGAEPKMTWNMAMFALEETIAGHSAVGNLLVKILGFLVTRPHVQELAQTEIDRIELPGKFVGLENRGNMPYTDAIILEAMRLIGTPIVPHVANQDSSVAGYKIAKDTFIFLNNYDLLTSEKLWASSEEFLPQRFVKNGKLLMPEHFLAFGGGGPRYCMGDKIVRYISFSTIATLLKNFKILPAENEIYKVPVGNLALPENTFNFRFVRR
ncbi:PREDICTED: cytochrome P450 307a1-like [Vollenhovia emeryi]|uniref:cytochrome P450 307a1-like n=1 Tax=Vollenhovia emeryi TaxID=411798 RepID=UPI0005F36669|nr:PREDICTED: cytochrome P450 307a1-like [Vollenhovia emeryi]